MIATQDIYDELHKKFIYLPETGLLIEKKTDQIVGRLMSPGYLRICFLNINEYVHQIAYFMYHGYLPKQIDHRNRIKTDNRIANLRDATHAENVRNTGNSVVNKSGVKGVTWNRHADRWTVTITHKKKSVHIGLFKNFINAVKARYYAEQKFDYLSSGMKSSAEEYLNNAEKISFYTNIEFEEESIPKNETIASEWEFFCYENKKKIDKLAEE